MTAQNEQLSKQALDLSEEERLDLAERLWASVGEARRKAIEEEWGEEIERRIDEVQAEPISTIPALAVFEQTRQQLRARRG